MKYKAVIFDLFGTLIENMSVTDYRVLLEDVTNLITTDQEQFIDLWLEYNNERMTGAHNNADSLKTVLQTMGLSPDPSTIAAALDVFNTPVEQRLKASNETLNTLSALHQRGYITTLASNCSAEVPPLWETSPLKSKICNPVFSCSSNCQKPDPAIYRLAASQIGITPEECLFVDDSIGALKGAAQVGMTPIHIQDKDLKSHHNDGRQWDGHTIYSIREIVDLADALNS